MSTKKPKTKTSAAVSKTLKKRRDKIKEINKVVSHRREIENRIAEHSQNVILRDSNPDTIRLVKRLNIDMNGRTYFKEGTTAILIELLYLKTEGNKDLIHKGVRKLTEKNLFVDKNGETSKNPSVRVHSISSILTGTPRLIVGYKGTKEIRGSYRTIEEVEKLVPEKALKVINTI